MTREEITTIVSRASLTSERDVKRVVRRVLDKAGIFNFMPPANGYGKVGISDILCVGNGKPIAIETKFGYNKPTPNQMKFGFEWTRAGGLFVIVNERNIVDELCKVVEFVRE